MDETNQKFVPIQQINEVSRFKESIRAIKEMIGRDKMKVVFFGRFATSEMKTIANIINFIRTSNGKSSVVNAMLGSRILPQGMGHTTCCFLQVEGGSENEKHFCVEDDINKIPISELVSLLNESK